MAFRVVPGDRVGDVLQDRRLARLGRRHDQRALALADRHDQVDYPGGQPVRRGFQTQPLVGVQRRQFGEIGPLLGVFDRSTVDAVQAYQRVELLPLVGLLAFLGHPDRAGYRVTAAQAVLAHHVHGHVDVVRAGQVAGGAHEGVIVEDVKNAGYRLDDVVVAQFGVATFAPGALTTPPAIAEPAASPALTAFAVVVLLIRAATLLAARALLVPALVAAPVRSRARRSWCPVGHPGGSQFFSAGVSPSDRVDDPASRDAPRRSRRCSSAPELAESFCSPWAAGASELGAGADSLDSWWFCADGALAVDAPLDCPLVS